MKEIARFFKVLADESRLKILVLLLNNRELCVCDIMEALGITQSKASRHLATMRNAGLVTDRKEGAWSYYSLRPLSSNLQQAQIKTLRTGLSTDPDAAEVLGKLRVWIDRKANCPACSAEPTANFSKKTGK